MSHQTELKKVEKELDKALDVHWERIGGFSLVIAVVVALLSSAPLGEKIVQAVMVFIIAGLANFWGAAMARAFVLKAAEVDPEDAPPGSEAYDKDVQNLGALAVTCIVVAVVLSLVSLWLFGGVIGNWTALLVPLLGQGIGASQYWEVVFKGVKLPEEKPKRHG